MIKFLPKKIIAAIIIMLGYTRIGFNYLKKNYEIVELILFVVIIPAILFCSVESSSSVEELIRLAIYYLIIILYFAIKRNYKKILEKISKYKIIILLSVLCLFFMGLSAVLLYDKYKEPKFDIESAVEDTSADQIPEGYEIEYIPAKTNLSKEDMARMEKIAKESGIDIENLKYKEKLPDTVPVREPNVVPKYISIPETHRTYREEYYYPPPQTYTPPQSETSNYDRIIKDYAEQQNKEIEERRIMQLESKVNHLELERDMRLLDY